MIGRSGATCSEYCAPIGCNNDVNDVCFAKFKNLRTEFERIKTNITVQLEWEQLCRLIR